MRQVCLHSDSNDPSRLELGLELTEQENVLRTPGIVVPDPKPNRGVREAAGVDRSLQRSGAKERGFAVVDIGREVLVEYITAIDVDGEIEGARRPSIVLILRQSC
jgi:hypothetical protein